MASDDTPRRVRDPLSILASFLARIAHPRFTSYITLCDCMMLASRDPRAYNINVPECEACGKPFRRYGAENPVDIGTSPRGFVIVGTVIEPLPLDDGAAEPSNN